MLFVASVAADGVELGRSVFAHRVILIEAETRVEAEVEAMERAYVLMPERNEYHIDLQDITFAAQSFTFRRNLCLLEKQVREEWAQEKQAQTEGQE